MKTQDTEIKDSIWKPFWGYYKAQFKELESLEARLSYSFQNRELLYEAMTHRSALVYFSLAKNPVRLPWNERLEFLGDSVLGLVITSMIWNRKESYNEGQFSQLKASLVSEDSLAKLARHLGLSQTLTVGPVEKRWKHHERSSLLADAMEALIGAMYLDSSYECVEEHVQRWFSEIFTMDEDVYDCKTRLQERLQQKFHRTPEYLTLAERGPDHAKVFRVGVSFGGEILAEAEAHSKKRASQAAAKLALEKWEDFPLFQDKKKV